MSAADRTAVNRVLANVGRALAAFQRQLVSRDAPFDRFVARLRSGEEPGTDLLDEQGHVLCWSAGRNPSDCSMESGFGPYMHQGQFASLREVLQYYSRLEGARPAGPHAERLLQPRQFEDGQIDDLIAFLDSLTDVEEVCAPEKKD